MSKLRVFSGLNFAWKAEINLMLLFIFLWYSINPGTFIQSKNVFNVVKHNKSIREFQNTIIKKKIGPENKTKNQLINPKRGKKINHN